MHGALTIAAKELRQRLRDRSALVLVVIAPLAIATLMSFAFHNVESFHYTLDVVDADRGPLGRSLVATVEQPSLARVVTTRLVPSATLAREQVRAGSAQAAVVVPRGFSVSVLGASPLPIRVLTSVNSPIAGSTTRAIVSSFVAQLNADRLSVATALAAGAPTSALARLEREVRALRIPEQTVARAVGARQLTAISYYAPAMAIFFLLFAVTFTARSFFVDKATGMVDRMRVAPLRPGEIVLGKALSAFALAAVALGVLGLVTSLAFGASWGAPLPAVAVGLAFSAAVGALTALVIVVARTERQAEGIGSLVVFALAVLGGNFIMQSSMSPLMRRLAFVTPNGWALRAFTDLGTVGGGFPRVSGALVGITLFAAVVGAVAVALAPRALSR